MEEREEIPEQKREAVELLASSNVVGGSYVPPHMRGQVKQINLSLHFLGVWRDGDFEK